MMPYFQWTQFMIGPIPIQVWGLCVALGMLAALQIARWTAKQRELSTQHIIDMGFWIILMSLLGSRVLYVLSEFQYYSGQLVDIFKIWEGGMSISGGYIGALIAAAWYTRKHTLSFLEYGEAYVFGLPVGLFIGRLGCFFIFDHPGRPTSFFLGQVYADGIVRHNHGLYLSIQGLCIAILFFILWKRRPVRIPGFYLILFLLLYGISRFILDFWRAVDLVNADSRFFGLTAAQYLSIFMVAASVVVWYYVYQRPQKNTHALRKKKETSS